MNLGKKNIEKKYPKQITDKKNREKNNGTKSDI